MPASILVVEDKRELADLYANWLAEGYDVQTAYSGEEALDRLDESIDVVLLDRRMPGLSGDEVLDRIRAGELDCMVAVVTAVEPSLEDLELDFDDYLVKPVSREDLHTVVDRLLTRRTYDEPLQEYFAMLSQQETVTTEAALSEVEGLAHGTEYGEDTLDMDVDAVASHSLPDSILDLAREYESKIGHRDRFLLQWLHIVFPFFTLSSVDGSYADRVRTDKTLASLFVMLVDDIGEHHTDYATLDEVSKLPFPSQSVDYTARGVDEDYLEVTESVWQALESRLADAPRYEEFEDLLRYDLRQVIHAVRYSMLVNEQPAIANLSELEEVEAHNMMMLAYADIDLAYSLAFSRDELGKLRKLIRRLQRMARIGNWITTWERELEEGDFSSGVVVYALENGIVSPEDLARVTDDKTARDDVEAAIRTASVEELLFERWEEQYTRLREDPPEIDSIDVEGLIEGMNQVMAYHLASRGLK